MDVVDGDLGTGLQVDRGDHPVPHIVPPVIEGRKIL